MKRYVQIILFLFLSYQTHAQPYVTIPDPLFRQIIDSIVPGSIVGTTLNTSHPGLASVYSLDMMGMGLTDITGVQYFYNLISLTCPNNQITFIPNLPYSLSALWIGNNLITSIPESFAASAVNDLRINNNPITAISNLPVNLYQLDVSGCNLTGLPALPPSLWMLWCSNCNLTSLPALPLTLNYLSCSNNQLSSLPTLPNNLMNLSASGNGLWCLPNLPTYPGFTSDIGYLVCTPQGTPDTWFRMAFQPNSGLEMASAFSIGNNVYVGGGSPSWISEQFWELNTITNTWTQKANVPVQGRLEPVAFSIGNKGYLGMGQGSNPILNFDLWEYDPVTNTWIQKANFPGTAYMGMASFVIGDKAYVGCGIATGYVFPTAFYKFNPLANTWTPIANFPSLGRREAGCFTLGNKGYVCAGDGSNNLLNTSYSYNPLTNTWAAIAPTPSLLNEAASFAINGKGYLACGRYYMWNGAMENRLLEYDPVTNTWITRADLPTLGRMRTTGCTANSRGYVGTGRIQTTTGGSTVTNDWWEYSPPCTTPQASIFINGGTGVCTGDSVMLFADPGNSYQWKRNGTNISGATKAYFYAKVSGNYTCAISNACGSVTSAPVTITVTTLPVATISAAGTTTFCSGDSVVLQANTGAGLTYQWKRYSNNIAGATSPTYSAKSTGTYKVLVTNNGGCSRASNALQVTVNPLPSASITAGGPITFCAGDSVILTANSGTGLSYQWKRYSNFIPNATSINYTVKYAGKYKCVVTNSNGCSRSSNAITTAVPCKTAGDSNMENEISVYPNPSSGEIWISTGDILSSDAKVQVHDISGRVVDCRFYFPDDRQIYVSGLPAGTYIISMEENGGLRYNKVIVAP